MGSYRQHPPRRKAETSPRPDLSTTPVTGFPNRRAKPVQSKMDIFIDGHCLPKNASRKAFEEAVAGEMAANGQLPKLRSFHGCATLVPPQKGIVTHHAAE